MKKIQLLPFFLLLSILTIAQNIDFNQYTNLISKGKLPVEFSAASRLRFENEVLTSANNDKSGIIAVNDFFRSGRVLFNDTIGGYLNKLIQNLIGNRAHSKEIRVFVVRSSMTNCFTTNEFVVFVPFGVLSVMQSESELAYTLAREYVHAIKKHVKANNYVYSGYSKYNENFQYAGIDEYYLSAQLYSNEAELEADELAFDLLLKGGYDKNAASSALKKLLYPELVLDTVNFSRKFFEKGDLEIPENLMLKDFKPNETLEYNDALVRIARKDSAKEIYDPNDLKNLKYISPRQERFEKILEFIKSVDSNKSINYILLSSNEFYTMKEICRFENVQLHLISGNFEKAIYCAMSLSEKYPESLYLKKIIAKSLYSIAKYGNSGYFTKAHINYEYSQGVFQQLIFLVGSLGTQGMNAVALNYLWDLKFKNFNDVEVDVYCRAMMNSMILTYNSKNNNVFYTNYQDTSKWILNRKKIENENDIEDDENENGKVTSKKEKVSIVMKISLHKEKKAQKRRNKHIKRAKEKEEDLITKTETPDWSSIKTLKPYLRKAFIYWFVNDQGFFNMFNEISANPTLLPLTPAQITDKYTGDIIVNKAYKKNKEKKNVIVLNPQFSFQTKKDNKTEYHIYKSRKGRESLLNAMEKVAATSFDDYAVLSQNILHTKDVEAFNEIVALKDCIWESNAKSDANVLPTNYIQVSEIAKKYHATHILLTSVIATKDNQELKDIIFWETNMYTLIVMGPILPVALLRVYARNHQYVMSNTFFDLKTCTFLVQNSRTVTGKPTKGSLNANLYNVISKLKTY